LNPSQRLRRRGFLRENPTIQPGDFETYLKLRDVEGITKEWQRDCERWIEQYLDFVDWKVDENKTLAYFQKLKDTSPVTYYRKRALQIRRFLQYLKVDWASKIKLPSEPFYNPKRITKQNILDTLANFENHLFYKQIKALVLLGATSGLRAEELYQLSPTDIDIENRIVYVNHNPSNGQTTKTGRSRVSFFNIEAQAALKDYFNYFNNGCNLKELFSPSHIHKIFNKAPVRVKDLRKFFSQEWERNCGPTGAKKLLMGHSGDVDLNHYNAQSNEDLKKIYDNVSICIGNNGQKAL
jgi:integrase